MRNTPPSCSLRCPSQANDKQGEIPEKKIKIMMRKRGKKNLFAQFSHGSSTQWKANANCVESWQREQWARNATEKLCQQHEADAPVLYRMPLPVCAHSLLSAVSLFLSPACFLMMKMMMKITDRIKIQIQTLVFFFCWDLSLINSVTSTRHKNDFEHIKIWETLTKRIVFF